MIGASHARRVNQAGQKNFRRVAKRCNHFPDSLLASDMAQLLQIDPAVFDEAPNLASATEPVAVAPMPVAVVQPAVQPLPVWYLTPVVIVPIAAAAFIIGNVLMMIPWQAL